MEIKYNVTGERRKELVKLIGESLAIKPKYLGMPSAAYEIGGFTVTKDGTLRFDDGVKAEQLLTAIAEAGFVCEAEAGIEVALPKDQFTNAQLENLRKLVDGKATLIKKALDAEALPIIVTDEKVAFPWFKETDPDSVSAYIKFITALCNMAQNAKRVNMTEKAVDNEKYAFRCFLLRLGFIGNEYRAERKILLKNLTGSSAFKSSVAREGSECNE